MLGSSVRWVIESFKDTAAEGLAVMAVLSPGEIGCRRLRQELQAADAILQERAKIISQLLGELQSSDWQRSEEHLNIVLDLERALMVLLHARIYIFDRFLEECYWAHFPMLRQVPDTDCFPVYEGKG